MQQMQHHMDVRRLSTQTVTAVVILSASVVEFSFTADLCNNPDYSGFTCTYHKAAWAIACGVISTVIALILLGFAYYRHRNTIYTKHDFLLIDFFLAAILVVFWIFGAAFNTKPDGIYSSPSNGYFSTWIAFFASVYYAHITLSAWLPGWDFHINWCSPIIVFIASLVEMSTAADALDNDDYSDAARAKWAVAVGVISSFFTLVQLVLLYCRMPVATTLGKPLAIFLVCLWAAGAGVSTSVKGPFLFTGNGFYSSWLAFGASLYYAFCVFFYTEEASSAPVAAGPGASGHNTAAPASSSGYPPIHPPPPVSSSSYNAGAGDRMETVSTPLSPGPQGTTADHNVSAV